MDRRSFMKQSIIGVSGVSALTAGSTWAQTNAKKPLTAGEVHQHLRSFGVKWINPEQTVDTFKAGGPDMVVKGIAVGWMSYFASLRQAHEMGCNLFVTHEPTYYDHWDKDASVFAFEAVKQKKAFIEETGIAIVRCHDVWDRVPEIGIRDAWASFLGFEKILDRRIAGDRAAGAPFCGVYEIEPQTAETLARHVAGKVTSLGQDQVQLLGPGDKTVRTVAVGTGAITPFREMVLDLRPDIVICSDDGFGYWRDGGLTIDMEYPVIIVNHACTEEIGIAKLAENLKKQFPQVPVHRIKQPCMFRTIQAG